MQYLEKIFKSKTIKVRGFFNNEKKNQLSYMSFVYYIWYIKISKNVLTFFIYVHVCTIKYDQMKECSALMMNSKQSLSAEDFRFIWLSLSEKLTITEIY